MKVGGPKGPGGVSPSSTKKAGKKSSGGSVFSVGETAPADTPAPVASTTGAGPLSAVDALLAIQSVDGNENANLAGGGNAQQQAIRHGHNMLDILEQIRMGLLTGRLPESRLSQLQQAISRQRQAVKDPNLGRLLDEIDLRAQVELAKLQPLR